MTGRDKTRAELSGLHADPTYLTALAGLESNPLAPSAPRPAPSANSIAVLPFVNMGGGLEGEALADGISEDIITALSRHSQLFVIARTSSFAFKGQAKDVKAIAAELGVRYVLEGSVRRAGDRLRVTAQLIDSAGGEHVWAERYDGSVDDIFDIQDKVTIAVATATHTELLLTTWGAREQVPKGNPRAWELAGLAYIKVYGQTRESILEGYRLAREALALEPTNIRAMRVTSAAISSGISMGVLPATPENLAKAIDLAEAAVQASRRDEISRWIYSWALANAGRNADSMRQLELAIEINPNYSLGHADLGERYADLGQADKAIASAELALKLNPLDPSNFWRSSCIAAAHLVDGRYDLALENANRSAQDNPDFPRAWLYVAASLSALGRIDEARRVLAKCLSLVPDLKSSNLFAVHAHSFSQNEDVRLRLLSALRQAGLPE